MQAYRQNPNVERIKRSSRVKPTKWRHFCNSPEVNATIDLPPPEGGFRKGIQCPNTGCNYTTNADTALVNCLGDPIETMKGVNLMTAVGYFNRFWRYHFECCRCTRWKTNSLVKLGAWEERRKAVGVDNCEHCGQWVEIDCEYCVSYNFYGEPIEFMDGKPFPFGSIWRHQKAGGMLENKDDDGRAFKITDFVV
ncbi:hypothetical protein C8A03DRAFT_13248 [Achaetomium macrosporum]|uniref:Uncharacterized protein n=1 Tax=Achaetomium macrosporum TaxID=79813 RepID=A0AAN7CE96_9PEZI|nr:hypothetical protein C8A03DRAFT_13248 [Achaetomium macrosporum]